jgi:hypothetical protein
MFGVMATQGVPSARPAGVSARSTEAAFWRHPIVVGIACAPLARCAGVRQAEARQVRRCSSDTYPTHDVTRRFSSG